MRRLLIAAKPRALLLACTAFALASGLALAFSLGHGHTNTKAVGSERSSASATGPVLVSGTPAAFRYLSNQTSNRCGLRPAELERYPATYRMQGSCCDPMDRSTYEWQIRALRAYAATPQIPRDPYDVPVALARQLLRYDRSIHLSSAQQATYDKAMRMSRERGPCCCHCWRWNAFSGMSKYLIARARWGAQPVALVIDDVQGCGGADEPPRAPSRHQRE